MHFRPLSRDPFTDIGRTIPEFRSVGLDDSKEFHSFSVNKKNVLEIDDEAARFLFQYAPKFNPSTPLASRSDSDVLDLSNTSAEASSSRTTHAAISPVFQVSRASVSRQKVSEGDSLRCVTQI
jgi:hypothetical protein